MALQDRGIALRMADFSIAYGECQLRALHDSVHMGKRIGQRDRQSRENTQDEQRCQALRWRRAIEDLGHGQCDTQWTSDGRTLVGEISGAQGCAGMGEFDRNLIRERPGVETCESVTRQHGECSREGGLAQHGTRDRGRSADEVQGAEPRHRFELAAEAGDGIGMTVGDDAPVFGEVHGLR
jgi:hypothetical protein